MHDRDALVRAIIENPADDAPRLVYADWLDEHGDPDRAEFIRVQCELARMGYGDPATTSRYATLSKQSRDLITTHKKQWDAEFSSLPPNRLTYFLYHRGMVNTVVCTVKYFLAHGDRLLTVAPLDLVEFRGLAAAHVRALTTCPWSRELRGVGVEYRPATAPAVEALLAAWPFPVARTLDLSSRYIDQTSAGWHARWATVAVALARTADLKQLRRLSLAACGIGDVGGQALADSPHLGGLEILDLKHNPVSADVRDALRQRFGRRVLFEYADNLGLRVSDVR